MGTTWFGYELVVGMSWSGYELVLDTSWLGYELAWYDLVRVRVDWKPTQLLLVQGIIKLVYTDMRKKRKKHYEKAYTHKTL